jgi:hypothetical protein
MIPDQFYYQFVVLGLLWLFIMLHLAWPSRDVTTQTKPSKALTPCRKCSTEPKVFAGLRQKPPCAWCEHEPAHPQAPLPAPPDPMPLTHCRPRTADTSQTDQERSRKIIRSHRVRDQAMTYRVFP